MSRSAQRGSHSGLKSQRKKIPATTITTGNANTSTGCRVRTPAHIDTPPVNTIIGRANQISGAR